MARNPRLTVGVGTPDNQFAPRWTFWTQKDDAYLTTRGMGGLYKLSLHASGVWVGAFTTESGVESSGNRRTHRWQRPPEFEPGFVRGPEICIPRLDSRHDLSFPLDPSAKNPVWVAAPQIRHSVHLMTVFHVDTDKVINQPPGSEILGRLPLSSESSFVVIAVEAELDREARKNVRDLRDGEAAGGVGIAGPIGQGRSWASLIRVGSGGDDGRPYITHVPLCSHHFHRTDGPLRNPAGETEAEVDGAS